MVAMVSTSSSNAKIWVNVADENTRREFSEAKKASTFSACLMSVSGLFISWSPSVCCSSSPSRLEDTRRAWRKSRRRRRRRSRLDPSDPHHVLIHDSALSVDPVDDLLLLPVRHCLLVGSVWIVEATALRKREHRLRRNHLESRPSVTVGRRLSQARELEHLSLLGDRKEPSGSLLETLLFASLERV